MRVYICISNRGRKRDHLLFVKASSGVCVDALALLFSNKKNVFVVVVLFSRSRVVVRDPTTMMSPRSLLGIEKIKKNRRYEEKEPTLFWSTQHDTKTQTKALNEEERERETTTPPFPAPSFLEKKKKKKKIEKRGPKRHLKAAAAAAV